MYKIKQIPEDFRVMEISNVKIGSEGRYSYFLLRKKNCPTMRAVERIAEMLKIPLKSIGFAGNKDKMAVTEQLISMKNVKIKKLRLKDIEVEFVGKGDEPISLGDLEGNQFTITVRNLVQGDIEKMESKGAEFPNYFGEQRFSTHNIEIGRAIVKKDFKKAVGFIVDSDKEQSVKLNSYLKENQNDYIGALRKIPLKLLRMYVHAYQSYLFNEAVDRCLSISKENIKIPIVGFGIEIKNKELEKIVIEILKKERIKFRDFIINKMPELSSEGGERELFEEAKKFKVLSVEEDEMNKDKKKVVLTFNLKKGVYATVFIRHLFA